MSLPANIRVNVRVTFPALVTGSGIVTVTKVNGRYTIGANPALLSTQNPLVNPISDFALLWDAAAGMMILVPLSVLVAQSRLQRSIRVAGDLPIRATDIQLNINAVTDLAPVVPLASSRNGAALTFKNKPGSHLQTLTRTGGDTFDGVDTLALAAGAAITLVPYNDGVNTGWGIE